MRRALVVVVLGVIALLTWWWWPGEPAAATPGASTPAESLALPAMKESAWSKPIVSRGSRTLRGLVKRDGEPVAGATVTATVAHGDEVLSDLPCQCDNHCGLKLLECGCAEAAAQLVSLVADRTGEGIPLARATTGPDGAFELTGLDDSVITLWADAPGAIGWVSDLDPSIKDVTVSVKPGRLLQGVVTHTDDKPAASVVVTAIFSKQSRFFDAVTDAEGRFKIGPVPEGKYAVVTMQAGFIPDHKQVREDDKREIALQLSTPRTLSGLVTLDGKPAAGATVKLDGMHRKRAVTATADGSFHFDALRAGEYELSAFVINGAGQTSARVSKHEDRTGVEIALGAAKTITGHVVDSRSAAVPRARVSLLVEDDWRTISADEQGSFKFEAVKVGKQTIYAIGRGFLGKRVETEADAVTLVLDDASVITGRVQTEAGILVAEFDIDAERPRDAGARRVRPDEFSSFDDEEDYGDYGSSEREGESASDSSTDGGFQLDLSPGAYTLWVKAPHFQPLTVPATAPSRDLVLTVSQGARVKGKVLDYEGAPAGDVRVAIWGTMERTAADGTFELDGLKPGPATIVATGEDFKVKEELKLTLGITTEIVLRPKEGARVSGVVIDAQGEPVAKVLVYAMGSEKFESNARSTTKADGTFVLRGLEPGRFTVTANREADRVSQVVTAPAEKVILKLGAGTRISGRVVDPKGAPIKMFSVLSRPFDTPDGKFEIRAIKGPMPVAFDAQGFAQKMMTVEVKDGLNDLGDIVMSTGTLVTGTVIDAQTRAPIAGALVDVGPDAPKGEVYLSERNGAARADEAGKFSLRVDPSSLFITATHDSYVTRTVELPPNANQITLALARGAALHVTVVDEKGNPARMVRLMVSQGDSMKAFRTEASGVSYVAEGLAPGQWTINAMAPQATYRPVTVTIGKEAMNIRLSPATDGVTVKIAGAEDAMSVMLLSGDHTSNMDSLRDSAAPPLMGRTLRNVLPGKWTIMGMRMGENAESYEISTQLIEITAEPEQTFQLSAPWRAFTPPR